MQDEEFSLENQRAIYRYILANPGAHLRRIAQDLSVPLSTIRYHINFLVRNRIAISKKEGNMKAYFINGEITRKDRRITPLLQQKRFRDIILLLILRPGLSHSDICAELEVKPPTLTKYMKVIEGKGIISSERNGREKRYFIVEEGRVIELLLTYKESFWDKFVDSALEIYFES